MYINFWIWFLSSEIHMKFHQNSISDSLQFSCHMPQNSPHSSPSVTRYQNQNQTRCQMILILILDLAHHLHFWMTMSHPQQLKNQWLTVHTDDNNGNKKT